MQLHSYADALSRYGVKHVRNGVWVIHGMPTLSHGWKLHLSAIQSNAIELIDRAMPFLTRFAVPFKVASGPHILGMLNEGLLGETQVGKFMTIYSDELEIETQKQLVKELIHATRDFIGPDIPTDARLGGTVYCRYGDYHPKKIRNRLGLFESSQEDQQLVKYSMPFQIPIGMTDGAKRYGINSDLADEEMCFVGDRYLLVGTLAVRAKGRVYLALDLGSQENVKKVVLKEGRIGFMSDDWGRDSRDRLLNHFHTEKAIRGSINTPKVEGLIEENRRTFLVLELLEGTDLGKLTPMPFWRREHHSRETMIGFLHGAAKHIQAMHDAGYVHRDLSPANIVVSGSTAYLTDFELAHRLGSRARPFTQGTVGFVSPQQELNFAPVAADDVYSFGAIVASLITGVPAHLLPVKCNDLEERIWRLSGGDKMMCKVIANCLAESPDSRPSLSDVAAVLSNFDGKVSFPQPRKRSEFQSFVEGGVDWLISEAARDEDDRAWLSPALEASHQSFGASVIDWRKYRSANRGVSGIVFLLSKLSRLGLIPKKKVCAEVSKAIDWLLEHRDTPDDQMPGLHFGEAGVALAIGEAIAAGIITKGKWSQPYFEEVFSSKPDWPDMWHGAAGQGMAALYVGWLLNETWLCSRSDAFANYLISQQAADGTWVLPKGVSSMEGQSFTGYAHGTAGIVTFLATHALMRENKKAAEAAINGGDWLLDEAAITIDGLGLTWNLNTETEESWAWWCHGAPGIALAYLALYRLTKDEHYAGTARACLRSVRHDIRTPNLSQCHGLSGLGELFFEAFDVLGDEEFFKRAMNITSQLADLSEPTKGNGWTWRVENIYINTADLMTGCAGCMHLLARACHSKANFGMPLQIPHNLEF